MTRYKYHNYKNTDQDLTHKPENLHLCVEMDDDTLYYVDDDDNKKMYKYVISTDIETELDLDPTNIYGGDDKSRPKNIVALFPDFTNGFIYFADSNWDNTTSYIWKLDTSDDSITELENTASINVYDVFVISGDVFYTYWAVSDGATRSVVIRPSADDTCHWDNTACPHWNKLNEAVEDPAAGDGVAIAGDEEDEYGYGGTGFPGVADVYEMTDPNKNDDEYMSDFDVKTYAKWTGHFENEYVAFILQPDGSTTSNLRKTSALTNVYAWYTINSSSFSNLPSLDEVSGDDFLVYMYSSGAAMFDIAVDTLYIDLEFTTQLFTVYVKEVGGAIDSIAYDSWNYDDDCSISQVVIVGSDAYILLWTESDGVSVYFWDNTAGTLTKKTTTASTTIKIPTNRERTTMTYDEDNIISFILYDSSDSKYYYYTYNISGATIEKGFEHTDIALMMNRNTNSSNAIPFNLEKGFNIAEDEIYQISKRRGNLWLISIYDFADNIIAITDHYVIDDSLNLYEYIDLMNYIVSWEFEHFKENYSQANMILRKDYIAVKKNMMMQLIGPYSSYDSLKFFKATENFYDETVGTSGTSIDFVDDSSGNIEIHAGLDGHGKIIEIDDDDGNAHYFKHELDTNQTYGSIEFKIRSTDCTKEGTITLYDSGDNIIAAVKIDADNWYTYSGSAWTDQTELGTPADDTWYIVRIDFETTVGGYQSLVENTYQVYVNETPLDTAEALETSDTNLSYFIVSTQAADQDYQIYFDAFGCPEEDSDYVLGYNKWVEKGQQDQVVFEGKVKGMDARTLKAVRLESPAIEMDRVKPSGSKSGRTDEIISDINDDDNGVSYISDGTLSVGAAMGTIEFGGDKVWRSIIDDLKDMDTFTWYLTPTSELYYDNGEVDTSVAVRYDGTTYFDKIEDANGFYIASSVNQVIVRGAIGIESDPANDEEDQRLGGIILYIVRDASLNTKALCDTKAAAILARTTDIATIRAMPVFDEIGFPQPGQVFTFKFVTSDVEIEEDTFTIDRVKFEAKSERYVIEATNGLIFKIEG